MSLRQRYQEHRTREELLTILKEKGDAWAIAAIIDGSIGYYSAGGARLVIQHFLEGADGCWSERALACFEASMLKMLSYDFGWFLETEKSDPRRAEILVKMGQDLLKLDDIEQVSFGLAYPTAGL